MPFLLADCAVSHAVGAAQRGAASFVAQLRDTKENSDVLVSLILTKDTLLIAGKPRHVPNNSAEFMPLHYIYSLLQRKATSCLSV